MFGNIGKAAENQVCFPRKEPYCKPGDCIGLMQYTGNMQSFSRLDGGKTHVSPGADDQIRLPFS